MSNCSEISNILSLQHWTKTKSNKNQTKMKHFSKWNNKKKLIKNLSNSEFCQQFSIFYSTKDSFLRAMEQYRPKPLKTHKWVRLLHCMPGLNDTESLELSLVNYAY